MCFLVEKYYFFGGQKVSYKERTNDDSYRFWLFNVYIAGQGPFSYVQRFLVTQKQGV